MPVYQVTYTSGAQQFIELSLDEADDLSGTMRKRACVQEQVGPFLDSTGLSYVWTSSSGATLDVRAIAGFQHYITEDYARWRSLEEEGDLERALSAATQAMMANSEVEEGIVVAVDTEPVRAAFLESLSPR